MQHGEHHLGVRLVHLKATAAHAAPEIVLRISPRHAAGLHSDNAAWGGTATKLASHEPLRYNDMLPRSTCLHGRTENRRCTESWASGRGRSAAHGRSSSTHPRGCWYRLHPNEASAGGTATHSGPGLGKTVARSEHTHRVKLARQCARPPSATYRSIHHVHLAPTQSCLRKLGQGALAAVDKLGSAARHCKSSRPRGCACSLGSATLTGRAPGPLGRHEERVDVRFGVLRERPMGPDMRHHLRFGDAYPRTVRADTDRHAAGAPTGATRLGDGLVEGAVLTVLGV